MPIDLDKLERLEREATPGNWYWSKDDDYMAHYLISSPRLETVLECDHCNEPDTADKNFIVALRNAAPAMIAELRAARERIVEMRRVLGIAQDALDRMMGDSDLDGDDSFEMRAMKAIASTLEEAPNAD